MSAELRPSGKAEDAAAQELLDWLSSAGFAVAGDDYSEAHFGNQVTDLFRNHSWVRLTRDRGQWWVEMGTRDPESDLFDPAVWWALLRSETEAGANLSIAADAETLKLVLPEIDRLLTTSTPDWDRLRHLRADRSARSLGLKGH